MIHIGRAIGGIDITHRLYTHIVNLGGCVVSEDDYAPS